MNIIKSITFGLLVIAIAGGARAQDSLGITKVSGLDYEWGPIVDIDIEGDYAYLADQYMGMRVIDISDPELPVQVGEFRTEGTPQTIQVLNERAFLGGRDLGEWQANDDGWLIDRAGGIYVLDISNPASPEELCFLDTLNQMTCFYAIEDYIYVGWTNDYGDIRDLIVYSIVDPRFPQYAEDFTAYPQAYKMLLLEGHLVLCLSGGFRIYDIGNPIFPDELGRIEQNGQFESAALFGDYLAMAGSNDGIVIYNVSNERNPLFVTQYEDQWSGGEFVISGFGEHLVAQLNYYELPRVFDIDQNDSLVWRGEFPTSNKFGNVDYRGNLAFTASGYGGMEVFDVGDLDALQKVAQISHPMSPNDVIVDGSIAYLANGPGGLRVIDVSNKRNPVEIKTYESISPSKVAIHNDMLITNGGSLRIYDKSDPDSLRLIGYIATGVNDFAFDGEVMILAGQGVGIYSISQPERPARLGEFLVPDPNYGNMTVMAVSLSGNILCVGYRGYNSNEIRVYDIARPATPDLLGIYASQGRLSDIEIYQDRLLVGHEWEGFGMQVLDISDPEHLREVGFINSASQVESIDISDTTMFVACGELGVKIFSIADIDNPQLLAWYDTKGSASGMDADWRYLYVADGNNFGIYDCSQVLSTPISTVLFPASLDMVAFPNPFNGVAAIHFDVPTRGNVRLSIFDPLGRRVQDLIPNTSLAKGSHKVVWDAGNLPSGAYIIKLDSEAGSLQQRLSLIR